MDYVPILSRVAWLVVGAAIAVALQGLFNWHRQRMRYELTYSVMTDTAVGAGSQNGPVVGIFEDREIRNPRLLVIRIQNTGTEEFTSGDFEDPVRFTISDNVKIVRIGNRSDERLKVTPLRPVSAGVPIGFNPLLLKPGDWFDLRVLAEIDKRASRRISISGRVRHINAPKLSDSSLPVDWLPGLKYSPRSRNMDRLGLRPRIPLAYAALLTIAIVAVIGFAAFSPSP